jgi:ATP-dependent helicase/DNAse subunit B
MADKFKATWISHSSIGDFLQCPRLYYLHNVYKDPKTNRKMAIVTPYMSLGIAVHEVLEGLVKFKAEDRGKQNLLETFEKEWQKVSGKKGGFTDYATEEEFYERGVEMINRAKANFGLFEDKTIRLKDDLPHFWLSEEEEIILCGKVDWIRYNEKDDSVQLVDFKTGRHKEKEASFQLPIYMLLMDRLQKRQTTAAFYWYLQTDNELTPNELPDIKQAEKDLFEVGKKIKLARAQKEFTCPHGGCRGCEPYEKILRGEAEFVGVGVYKQDMYIIPPEEKPEDLGNGVIEF